VRIPRAYQCTFGVLTNMTSMLAFHVLTNHLQSRIQGELQWSYNAFGQTNS
jgi:hypothetical protein